MRAHEIIELLVANKFRIMQTAPIASHVAADAVVKQHRIRFTLVEFAKHQRLIFETIVLDIGSGDDKVNLVQSSVRKLIDIDGLTRIHAFASLHKIQCETFVQIGWTGRLYLLPYLRIVLLKGSKRFFQLIVATGSAMALLAHVVITRDLDEDICRSMTCDMSNLVDNANRLVETATNCGRPWKIVHAKRTASLGKVRTVK